MHSRRVIILTNILVNIAWAVTPKVTGKVSKKLLNPLVSKGFNISLYKAAINIYFVTISVMGNKVFQYIQIYIYIYIYIYHRPPAYLSKGRWLDDECRGHYNTNQSSFTNYYHKIIGYPNSLVGRLCDGGIDVAMEMRVALSKYDYVHSILFEID